MKRVLVLGSILMACGGDDASDTAGTAAGDVFPGAPLSELSSGDCPKLENPGERSFTSNGVDRDVLLHFPKNPEPGLPVVFVWHGLGDSAQGISNGLRLEDFANDNNAVVVVPQSTDPMLITWDIFNGGDDAVLFDDMRTCLSQELDVDLTRVSTTGFSFGALMTTWLTMNRADSLSASVSMSGGTSSDLGFGYTKPVSPVPTLVMWGGDADTFSNGMVGVDFKEASTSFADSLEADGHLVARCDHGLGHTLPMDYADAMTPWLLDHSFESKSPFEGGLKGFPDYCSL